METGRRDTSGARPPSTWVVDGCQLTHEIINGTSSAYSPNLATLTGPSTLGLLLSYSLSAHISSAFQTTQVNLIQSFSTSLASLDRLLFFSSFLFSLFFVFVFISILISFASQPRRRPT